MITRSIEEVKLSSAIADELLPSITGKASVGTTVACDDASAAPLPSALTGQKYS